MTHDPEHQPGDPAPVSGHYRALNVFGAPTDRKVHVWRGDPLPLAPEGYSWRLEQQTHEED